ncbi:hypothetical protein LPB72_07540 [Hydrogenophaga crassostreae]|uniref:AlgX/AlgJ SGNH hydrolase-like domain-containing protein n=2 Tax=Hydrogenophaga crassostreae TaxID=1763535 RepID=A0A167IHB3_9BURK|nr:hypothetical protein LPB072_09830 [Hydrogenophaga crassostreae]OAD42749.1 hypothetical protein LPB72_07540 [Hydrogenophaga crassostreae]
MVAPSKESIYPEFLPNWVHPPRHGVTDAIFQGLGTSVFEDLRVPLLAAKSHEPERLFFKFDTHWNMVGASYAFQAFAKRMKLLDPELKWPDASSYQVFDLVSTDRGDLAEFLRLGSMSEKLPILEMNRLAPTFARHGYGSGQVIDPVGVAGARVSLTRPIVTKNAHALNRSRVLWLSDSFGAHLADPMSTTFSDVVRVHWDRAYEDGGMLVRMVREWNPDFVFVTVAERSLHGIKFETFLQYAPFPATEPSFDHLTAIPLAMRSVKGLAKGDEEGVFEVVSDAPSMMLSAPADIDAMGGGAFLLAMTCLDKSASLPVQAFWKPSSAAGFDRDHAQRFLHVGERSMVPLPEASIAKIRDVRLDLKTNGFCKRFRWDSLSFVGTEIP